jgi:hypothetical protein
LSGECCGHGVDEKLYRILAGKLEEVIAFGRRRREDNIKRGFKETACEDVGWIHLFRGRSSSRLLWTPSLIFRFHRRKNLLIISATFSF